METTYTTKQGYVLELPTSIAQTYERWKLDAVGAAGFAFLTAGDLASQTFSHARGGSLLGIISLGMCAAMSVLALEDSRKLQWGTYDFERTLTVKPTWRGRLISGRLGSAGVRSCLHLGGMVGAAALGWALNS